MSDLVKKWFLKWFSDNTFRPNEKITRAELLKLLLLVKWVSLSTSKEIFFNDIFQQWQKKYIITALELKIISQKNKSFLPDNPITKVEAIKIAINTFLWDDFKYLEKNYFLDVKQNDWFYKYANFAYENNILEFSNNFLPNDFITRLEVIIMLNNLKDLKK